MPLFKHVAHLYFPAKCCMESNGRKSWCWT